MDKQVKKTNNDDCNNRTTIIKSAILSRLILIILQFVSNQLIPDHQADDVFHYPKLSNQNSTTTTTIFDSIIDTGLNGFLRWDSQYFLHIAKYGYTYENCLAFFPLYPLFVRYISLVFYYNLGLSNIVTSYDSVLLITFINVNIVFFILAALTLYELSNFVVVSNSSSSSSSSNKKFALKSTILFCYNPASVFFIAPYTETIFCYLTFKSMLYCLRFYQQATICRNFKSILQQKRLFIIIITLIGLSTLTRSNGVLNIGFIVYTLIALFLKQEEEIRNNDYLLMLLKMLKYLSIISFTIILCLLPFISFQYFSYQQFCKDFKIDHDDDDDDAGVIQQYAKINNLRLPGNFVKYNQSWCYNKVPLAYSYVQNYYWNVGFLNYYQFKQIPNFLLASPIIYIIVSNSIKFFQQYFNNNLSFKRIFNLHFIFDHNNKKSMKIFRHHHHYLLNDGSLVFIVHAFVLTIFCICNIHIQVTTRILCSASPVFYWFIAGTNSTVATTTTTTIKNNIQMKLPLFHYKNWLYYYFNSFFLIGTILFCNFLPWT